jgi:hypothetical protein
LISAKWIRQESTDKQIQKYRVTILSFIFNSNLNRTQAICNYYGKLTTIELDELEIDSL